MRLCSSAAFFFFGIVLTGPLQPAVADSLSIVSDLDSLKRAESAVIKPVEADTSKPVKKHASDLQGPIVYEARIIENLVDKKITILTDRAKVNYLDIKLAAARITVNWDTRELTAEGLPDTVISVNEQGDSLSTIEIKGQPEFTEAGDVMVGEKMTYNFKTRKALVLRGRTEYDAGFYKGRAMKLSGKKQIYVGDAQFTTCDRPDTSHFHFGSEKMKILVNDKVIVKPVVMYIGNIPVMALPFALFPIQKGRHSGLLIPRYGESTREGRSLRGWGYYWAPSDYWDATATANYYEKSGFLFRGDLRYNKRDELRGNVSGSVTRKDFQVTGLKQRWWDLDVRHNQTISPNTNLTVNARLVSADDLYRELSANREHRLQGQITSNATLTHRLGRSGNFTVNLNQTRNLRKDSVNLSLPHITETMPQIQFSNQWSNLIPGSRKKGAGTWMEEISIPYSFQFLGRRQRTSYQPGFGKTRIKEGMGVDHNLSVYVSPKLFGWLNLQPRFNYSETWLDRRKAHSFDDSTHEIEDHVERGFFIIRTFDTYVSANTKIYGMFRSRFIPEVQIRHVITPQISLSYRPDFSDEKWGYYVAVEDTSGVEWKDPYSESILGGTPSGGSKSMNFSINNVFQMKKGEGEKAKKIELFYYNMSSAYNWMAKKQRFSDVHSSFRAKLFRDFNLSLNTTHSFYQTDSNGRTTNRLLIRNIRGLDWDALNKARLARMTRMDFNLTFSLKGKVTQTPLKPASASIPGPETVNSLELNPLQDDYDELERQITGDRFDMDERTSDGNIPWNLRSTFSYSLNRGTTTTRKIWTRLNCDMNITSNWKITWSSQIDLKQKELVSQDFVFYRDLHCWEAQVWWTPMGYNKRLYLRINVKSSMLKDIKVEKGSGSTGYYGY
jgi:lipopolysaccharide assembly outer membrane protein LptD (OstA)